jgi:transposase InsO family protein
MTPRTHAGELTKHVIVHCLAAFTTMGKPQQLKTNNGPAYISTAFQHFCEAYQIHHITSIPYNSQGQAIVEHIHATLKMQFKKLKDGDEVLSPAIQLHKVLHTLHFLNCPEQGLTSAEKHWQPQEPTVRPQVLWKNVLTGKLHNPSLVLMWGQGHVCVFPEGSEGLKTLVVFQASWIHWF